MAEPVTQVERKLKELEEKLERNDRAIRTLAWWLVQAQTGFGERDAEGIIRILNGQDTDRKE